MKRWHQVEGIRIVETEKYRYEMGYYNHAEYGDNCFRVSKFLKSNGYFIGHFVIVPEDQEVVIPALESTMNEGCIL